MRLRTHFLLITGVALLGISGCHEPRQITKAYAPGYEPERIPTEPETDAPQAIGEQVVAQKRAEAEKKAAEKKGTSTAASVEASKVAPLAPQVKLPSGLIYEILAEGKEPAVKSGQSILMHYVGTLTDGTVFDSSRKRGEPFPTTIGVGQVIRGWDEGVPGMKIGERRRLIIPPELGYGARGAPGIPGNSTLIFEVELMDIR